VGGHFRELLQLRPLLAQHRHFYVLNDRMEASPGLAARMIRITHAEREWRQVFNFVEGWRILRRLRPDLIVTTGASPAVVFGLLGRWLRIPMVYVEGSYAVQRPTLTGWLVYHLRLAELFLYQWPALQRHYPRAKYAGLIF
jgi:UDP-N-acetylglucosamine:LPS N-acetylglucosamine transferase